MKKKKYCFDVRDLYPQIFVYSRLVSSHNPIYKIVERWTSYIYTKAHKVITVTESLQKKIFHQSGHKPLLIRNGHENDIPSGLNKHSVFSCIYHGTLGQFQRIDLILELAKKLPHIHFYIAGSGPKSALFKQSKLDNVFYLGSLERAEILSHLSKCHLGLSLLDQNDIGRDSFPVKVYEFFAAGLPTVVTPQGEVSSVLDKHHIGKGFPPDNVDDISQFIQSMEDDKIYNEMKKSLESVSSRFSRDFSTQKLKDHLFS